MEQVGDINREDLRSPQREVVQVQLKTQPPWTLRASKATFLDPAHEELGLNTLTAPETPRRSVSFTYDIDQPLFGAKVDPSASAQAPRASPTRVHVSYDATPITNVDGRRSTL